MNNQDQPGSGKNRKRPGPFGPARVLLPADQQMTILDAKTPAGEAIERMVDERFSQIPVADKSGKIIGVFSWSSFGKRVSDLSSTKINLTELPIREAMEPARFIGPDVYIDTATDWGDIDHVLVGHENDLMGVLCIADVFGRLNDFAEAFVLLYEIEHEIRDLINDVCDDETRDRLIADLSLPPNARRPQALEEFTFNQYALLVCSKKNWELFEPLFDSMRELVNADFNEVNELRNVVFHFRRSITPKDTDRLRRFRDRLRYDRELYRNEMADKALESTQELST